MRIAIPTKGKDVNQRFNDSETFTVFDVQDGKVIGKETIFATGFNHEQDHLAGLLNSVGATVVITGTIDLGGISSLQEVGFEVLTGAKGEAHTVAELYALGEFSLANTIFGDYPHHQLNDLVH